MPCSTRLLTAGTLAAIGGVHVAWALGSSFPFRSRAELADAVVGADTVPPATACYAVSGLLFTASALVADMPIAPRRVRRLGRGVVASTLAVRGALGISGRTDVVSPGSSSPRFRRLDRMIFAPLCLALAAGSLAERHGGAGAS